MASEAQVKFIIALVGQKVCTPDMTAEDRAEILRKSEEWARGATTRAACIQIDRLKALPHTAPAVTAPAAPSVVEPGFYLLDGDIVKVQKSQAGRFYAKTLIVSTKRFEYAPGVVHKLTPADLLTVEQAAKFGHETGVCAVCARDLSDPVSVERGIGPVCYKRFS